MKFKMVPPGYLLRRPTPQLAVAAFLLAGLLETVLALLLFQRADDHGYFLSVANIGTAAVIDTGNQDYDLKARIVATVFHVLASPVRWLGANETAYVLWMRVLTLAGFLFAFEGLRRLLPARPDDRGGHAARARFMLLCLAYPGQLAWTASLLRDGVGAALFFAALWAWAARWRGAAIVLLVLSLTLRPELAAVALLMLLARALFRRWQPQRRRLWLVLCLVGLTLAAFTPRQAASEFALYAWGEEGAAYPGIAHLADIKGYVMVFIQGAIDPLSLGNLTSINAFGAAEVLFFIWLLVTGWRRLASAEVFSAGLIAGLLLALWLFAYVEIYVGAYTRHRLAMVVMMLALLALNRAPSKVLSVQRSAASVVTRPS